MPGVAVEDLELSACLAAGGDPRGLPPYLAQSLGTTGGGKWRDWRVFRNVNKGC